jgi:anti-sigma-K factor RskA
MTNPSLTPDERAQLAAEYALGALDGAELAQARALAASDAEFRADAARWKGRLAPMLDEVEPVSAPSRLWGRIDAAIGGRDDVVELRRSVTTWRGISAAMTALAACLALLLLVQPRLTAPPPGPVSGAPPLVAMMGDDKQMKLVASWDPMGSRLVLAMAGDMPADTAHAHEVWIIPSGGKPHSLGTMPGKRQTHMRLAETLAELMRQGATIAISVEPPGGSPTGAPTGPVIASGTLKSA